MSSVKPYNELANKRKICYDVSVYPDTFVCSYCHSSMKILTSEGHTLTQCYAGCVPFYCPYCGRLIQY